MSKLQNKFGTAPVFFTAISTILGAVMFLRFGFAVGNVGFIGTLAIIAIGHMVTIPTAMAIAEIATNQKVEGGGEYYIISRSFGLVIGSAIGIALYFSQGISVAFYIMAFAEAFTPLIEYLSTKFTIPDWLYWLLQQKQTIGIPALLLLTFLMLTKGADLGVKVLYFVVTILAFSIVAFFIGETDYAQQHSLDLFAKIDNYESVQIIDSNIIDPETTAISDPVFELQLGSDSILDPLNEVTLQPAKTDMETPLPVIPEGLDFFIVFAIIFPAFTGMTAGVGLSGDLEDPGRSIPLGTLAGTLAGMVVYCFIAWKLAVSASPVDLVNTDKLVMADIAWQGWLLIPLGLAAATISSALGSILVAPRTLQAIARDKVLPIPAFNKWLSVGRGESDEPINASIVTVLLAGVFVLAGALDSVAQIISMFFMVTYGSLCLISFLNHFASDPSYRPKFRSRWYISLFGAVACFGLMFFMNGLYAFLSIATMVGLYFFISFYNQDKKSMALIFQGVIFQLSRQLQVFLQKADKEQGETWRPSAVALSENSFKRLGAFDLLRWMSHKYGFGTYIHQIKGYLSRQTNLEANACKERLIKMAEKTDSNIYVDTMISPSFTSSIAQVIQLPGIAGTENNLILFEFSKQNPEELSDIIDNFKLIKSVDFDVLLLGSCERGFGLKKSIHIWLTAADYQNANLMILLSYVILGHKDWKDAEIKIFAVYPESSIQEERRELLDLINNGQLPISSKNIKFISRKENSQLKAVISETSYDADLTIVGFHSDMVKQYGEDLFLDYDDVGNVLFVNAGDKKVIK